MEKTSCAAGVTKFTTQSLQEKCRLSVAKSRGRKRVGASGPERSENKEYTEGKILEEGKHINTRRNY